MKKINYNEHMSDNFQGKKSETGNNLKNGTGMSNLKIQTIND